MTIRSMNQILVDDIRMALSLSEDVEFYVGCLKNNGYVAVKEVLEPIYHKTESGSKDTFYRFRMVDGIVMEYRRGEAVDIE